MLSILTSLSRFVFRCCLKATLIVCVIGIIPVLTTPSNEEYKRDIVRDYASYVRPMTRLDGSRYCSSSTIDFAGSILTVTNKHCCDYESFPGSYRLINGALEKILYISDSHDVCVLTSGDTESPIKVARRDVKVLDVVLVLGYPRGTFLTPRKGHVVAKDVFVSTGGPKRPSHFLSTTTYPGNSGSPVFNENGELVGLIYAGSRTLVTYGITVPYRYLLESLIVAKMAQQLDE